MISLIIAALLAVFCLGHYLGSRGQREHIKSMLRLGGSTRVLLEVMEETDGERP